MDDIKDETDKTDENEKNGDELMDRKAAARYLRVSPGTLAVWDCTKRYDLKPVRMGKKCVRYWKSNLDKFLSEVMQTA